MPLKVGTLIPNISDARVATHAVIPVAFGQHNGILVYFWAMSCPACKVNMPGLQALRDKYAPHGLQTIAIHMPRMEADMDVEKVKATCIELGITEPCAIDNDHKIGDAFQTGGVWPVYYLFGADGRLKRHAAGGFGIRVITQVVDRLFATDQVEVSA